MLRDDRDHGRGRRLTARNVLGEPLEICSIKPMTGFYRDGCCNTGQEDIGSHTVCAVMTSAFLEFSKSHGNDLSTPIPELGFPGLKAGDRWCLCAPRWQEAFEANQALSAPTHLGLVRVNAASRFRHCVRCRMRASPEGVALVDVGVRLSSSTSGMAAFPIRPVGYYR